MTSEEMEEIMRLQKESLRGCSLYNTLKHISHHTHLLLRCIDAIDLLLESLFVIFCLLILCFLLCFLCLLMLRLFLCRLFVFLANRNVVFGLFVFTAKGGGFEV